jgi:hypothetical protein
MSTQSYKKKKKNTKSKVDPEPNKASQHDDLSLGFNYATRQEDDVRAKEGISPRILNLSTRWGEWSASRSGSFILEEGVPGYEGGWAPEPVCPYRESKPGHSECSLVTILSYPN